MNVIKRHGKWQYDFRIGSKRIRKQGFRTKKEAEQAGVQRYNELTKGIDVENQITFAEYAAKWIETYKKPYISAKTYSDNKRVIKRLREYFKHVPMNKITRTQYQDFLTHFKDTLSQDQLGRINALCKKIVDYAIYDGVIIKDFTIGTQVKSSKPPVKQETDKYLNLEELKLIKDFFLKRHKHYAASTHIILLMIETGGRFSDCINLKREHINEVQNTVYLDGSKNKNAKRTVKVSKECIDLLIDYVNNHPISLDGYVFTHNGKRIINKTVNKAIKQACIELDIRRSITSHAFRHTHASYLISQNINIYYISKRLGHSDISMTLNKYGHLLEEVREKDEEKTISLITAL